MDAEKKIKSLYNISSHIKNELGRAEKNKTVAPDSPPEIDLYMDQILTFLRTHLGGENARDEERQLTKTMINNYTKKGLIPAPDKKKYNKDHIYLLSLIYYLKNALTIEEISTLFSPLSEITKNEKNGLDVHEIYSRLYELQNMQLESMKKDILQKGAKAEGSFSDVTGKDEKKYLELLSMISLLCTDICLKKNMIENLVAELAVVNESKAEAQKKAEAELKLKEKAKKSS